jgi:predicted DNA-binding transcriptional regulator YafY
MKYDRIHRLLRLITLIQGSTDLNAGRLAELFETTERTIYRDLEVLVEAGVPISFDPETGGYSIRKDFFLRPVDLTLEEAMGMLLLADQVGAREQIPHLAAAGKAAEKLLAILPRPIGEIIQEVMPNVAVSLARSSNEPTEDVYAAMRDAIQRRRALECEYESLSRKPQEDAGIFRFDPFALYFGQRAWYVVGLHHGRNEIRTLKLSRFTRQKSIERPFAIPDDFSLDRHFGKAWRMMPSGTRTIHDIKIRFDATVAENVADTHWHDSQDVEFLADGSVEVSFQVDGLEEIIWWILSYGPHCQVLGPPVLRERVVKLAKGMVERYGGGDVT